MLAETVCMEVITRMVAKVEAVSVSNSMLEKVEAASWDRFKVDSAWE